MLDQPRSNLVELSSLAAQQGLLEFRHAGGVIEVSFRELLRLFPGDSRGVLL